MKVKTPRLYTDSSTALSSSKRLGPSTKLRHLAVAHFYVQGMVRAGDLSTHKCKGTENPANALTKHLNAKDLKEAMPWMGMENLGTAENKESIEASRSLVISGVSHDVIEKEILPRAGKALPWKPCVAAVTSALELMVVSQLLGQGRAEPGPQDRGHAPAVIDNRLSQYVEPVKDLSSAVGGHPRVCERRDIRRIAIWAVQANA